ncbi:hypothetical protein ACI3L3_01990 [Desulfobaculum sp. SPO524]|uniref:hypothetical protein n=1 Tax=Desulfobaculum sp. SPO524 TaxID=3378071 RepID=UPI0038521889
MRLALVTVLALVLAACAAPARAETCAANAATWRFTLEEDHTALVRARITPCTIQRDVVRDSRILTSAPRTIINGQRGQFPTWRISLKDDPAPVARLPYLAVTWTSNGAQALPSIQLRARLHGAQDTAPITLVYENELDTTQKPTRRVSIVPATLGKKDTLYLVRRELGLGASGGWRRTFDGQHMVLQGRVDIPVTDGGLLRLRSPRGEEPKSIQFSLNTNAAPGRDVFLYSDEVTRQDTTIGDSTVTTLNLRPALRARHLRPQRVTVMEVLLFYPADSPAARSSAERTLSFHAMDLSGQRREVTAQFLPHGVASTTMLIDLRHALGTSTSPYATLRHLLLTVRPAPSQAITVTGIRLLDLTPAQIPALDKTIGDAVQTWAEAPRAASPFLRSVSMPVQSIFSLTDDEIWRAQYLRKERPAATLWRLGLWPEAPIPAAVNATATDGSAALLDLPPHFTALTGDMAQKAITTLTTIPEDGLPIPAGTTALLTPLLMTESADSPVPLGAREWWTRQETLVMPHHTHARVARQENGALLVTADMVPPTSVRFTAPQVTALRWDTLHAPLAPYPSRITLNLPDGGSRTLAPGETFSLKDTAPHMRGGSPLTVDVSYLGAEPFFGITPPRVELYGVRSHTPKTLAAQLLHVEGATATPGLPLSKTWNGGWADAAQMHLAAGETAITLRPHPLFAVDAVEIITQTPPHLRRSPIDEHAGQRRAGLPFISTDVLILAMAGLAMYALFKTGRFGLGAPVSALRGVRRAFLRRSAPTRCAIAGLLIAGGSGVHIAQQGPNATATLFSGGGAAILLAMAGAALTRRFAPDIAAHPARRALAAAGLALLGIILCRAAGFLPGAEMLAFALFYLLALAGWRTRGMFAPQPHEDAS